LGECASVMSCGQTVGQVPFPSLYIGSIVNDPQERVARLPDWIKSSILTEEPRPSVKGWVYRVLQPFYTKDNVDDVEEAMMSGQISSGASWPRQLASQICSLYGVPVALPTSSGASALTFALLACHLTSQDQVLVPAFTLVAVANAVKMVGAKPIYCDNAAGSVNPGVQQYLEKATPCVKAVIVCHTYGIACKDIVELAELCAERGWWLIEDICESMGT